MDDWTLELNGWRTGTFDVSVVIPATSQTYKMFAWSGIPITQGGKYRIRFKPLSLSSNIYLEEYRTNGWEATHDHYRHGAEPTRAARGRRNPGDAQPWLPVVTSMAA